MYQTSDEQYLCAALHAVNNIQETKTYDNKKINYFFVSKKEGRIVAKKDEKNECKIYPTNI